MKKWEIIFTVGAARRRYHSITVDAPNAKVAKSIGVEYKNDKMDADMERAGNKIFHRKSVIKTSVSIANPGGTKQESKNL